jgi:hypothetical protein
VPTILCFHLPIFLVQNAVPLLIIILFIIISFHNTIYCYFWSDRKRVDLDGDGVIFKNFWYGWIFLNNLFLCIDRQSETHRVCQLLGLIEEGRLDCSLLIIKKEKITLLMMNKKKENMNLITIY